MDFGASAQVSSIVKFVESLFKKHCVEPALLSYEITPVKRSIREYLAFVPI